MSLEKPGVVVIDADQQQSRNLCTLLQHQGYRVIPLDSPDDLEGQLQTDPEVVVLLSLDTVAVDSQFLRTLKKKHPNLHLLGLSGLSYHPGLEEVIGTYLYACLRKPLDLEELHFWLKSIAENLAQAKR